MKQTRTLTFDKVYDREEGFCHFVEQTNDGPQDTTPEGIAANILAYLEEMRNNRSNAKISVSFREEV
jgi:hypothetical protein